MNAPARRLTLQGKAMVFLAVVLLAAAPALARDEGVVDQGETTSLTASRLPAPPKIDGRLDAGEWSAAAMVAGFYEHRDVPKLMGEGPVLAAGYDERALYLMVLTPMPDERPLRVEADSRDGRVYRDDSVEIYLRNDRVQDGGVQFQFIVNSEGTIQDARANNFRWNGAIDAAGGADDGAGLIDPVLAEGLTLPGRWWLAEMALPWSVLEIETPAAGEVLRINVGVNRPLPWAVLGPTQSSSYADEAAFMDLRLLPAGSPYVQLTGLGDPGLGRVRLRGRAANPSGEPVDLRLHCDAWKAGSTVTGGAYQEIVGAISPMQRSLDLPPGGAVALDVRRDLDDRRLDRLAVRVFGASENKPLLARPGALEIRPPLSLDLGNVPSRKYLRLDLDASGLEAAPERIEIDVYDEAGERVLQRRLDGLPDGSAVTLDYSALPAGMYRCVVGAFAGRQSEPAATVEARFRSIDRPAWHSGLYDRYLADPRVLKPWTPIEYGPGRELSVWGRQMSWADGSLPARVRSGGEDLLTGPIRLRGRTADGECEAVLTDWRLTRRDGHRAEIVAEAVLGPARLRLSMWLEYDGLLWVTIRPAEGENARAETVFESLRLEIPLKRSIAKVYQGHDNHSVGWIAEEPVAFAWREDPAKLTVNFYHWMGDEGRGLGVTYRTLEHWTCRDESRFAEILPAAGDEETVLYRANLIERPASLAGRSFEFGLQATPVKPLPPDWHAMLGCQFWTTYIDRPSTRYVPHRYPEQVDVLLNWHPNVGMEGLNGVETADPDASRAAVAFAHDRGMSITTPSICPQKISPLMVGFEDYRLEWINLPVSTLTFDELTHYQNCAGAGSYLRRLFVSLVESVQTYGYDGVYFDGWPAGQMGCFSEHHGCGWVDANGERHLTVACLEGRRFFQALAAWMEDHVHSPYIPPAAAPARESFPDYHLYVHTWCMVPPTIGFATMWFTGEFACYPFRTDAPGMKSPEGRLSEAVGLDMYLARCLSTNWGVPNLFDTLNRTTRQSEMMVAWLLPYGTPIGAPEYMAAGYRIAGKVVEVFSDFDARRATFTPAWRENPHLKIVSDNPGGLAVVGTWAHRADQVLAVISNLDGEATRRIELELLKLDPAETVVTEAFTGENVELTGGRLVLTIEPEMYRLLRIRRAAEEE
jgi:hypothetical protein